MIKFVLCVLLGIVGHQTSPVFDLLEDRLNGRGQAWPRIGRYSVGGIMLWVAVRLMLKGKPVDSDMIDGAIAKALIPLGAGVCLGYVLDMSNE